MKLPSPIHISDHFGAEFNFDTFEAFEEFIKGQQEFWAQRQPIAHQSENANTFIQRYNGFQRIIHDINAWKPQLETWEATTFNSNLTNLINSQIGNFWLWSSHPFVEKWLQLSEESIVIADAFFEAIVQKTTSRFSKGIDYFQGYIIAYEYLNQGNTNINKRRKSEEKSMDKLRAEIAEKQSELISDVSNFQSEINEWQETAKQELSDLLINKEKCLDDTNEYHSQSFHSQLASWTEKHNELENRFRNELRWESPAEYWGKKANDFKQQGHGWLTLLLAGIVFGIVVFAISFNTWLVSVKDTKIGLDTVEGILLFACLVSVYAFFIKSISKLTFSSFHLMRDAEEREQLTHLYLSLRDGKEDDPESLRIILQALFSRSDTGLLAGDHSPTMPSIQDAIKIIR